MKKLTLICLAFLSIFLMALEDHMRRYFKSILVLIFVGLLLTGAGKAQTLSDTESEMLLDSLSDWADFPDDQEVTSRRLAGIRVGIDPGHRNREIGKRKP